MSVLSQIGESLIDQAIESGELRPPPPETMLDLKAYFQTPESWRAAHAMLHGQGFLPPGLEELRQAEALEEELRDCADAAKRLKLRQRIGELRSRFQMELERLREL